MVRAWPLLLFATGCSVVSGVDGFAVDPQAQSVAASTSSSGGMLPVGGSAGAPPMGGAPGCRASAVDEFRDDAVDMSKWAPWTMGDAGYDQTSGRFEVRWDGGDQEAAGLHSLPALPLSGCAVQIEVVQAPSAAATQAFFYVGTGTNERAGFRALDGNLVMVVEGTGSFSSQLTFQATDHRFWRLRESDGTLFWETSPDGVVWAPQAMQATPPLFDEPRSINFGGGATSAAGRSDEAFFDNYRVGMP
jgi:hypothetical protein